MTDEALAARANRHYGDAYRKLIEHARGEARDFGPVLAFVSGVPIAFANGCVVMTEVSREDLRAAIGWVEAHGQPFQVHVDAYRAPGASQVALAHGLAADPRSPVMGLEPLPAAPPPVRGISIAAVDAASYEDFVLATTLTWMPERMVRRLTPPSLTLDPEVRCFVARLNGEIAGTSTAIRTGTVTGIYAVGTAEPARRRGVGTALTWAAVSAARDWGSEAVFLQSSAMGLPVYRAMGFRTVGEYSAFSSAGKRRPVVTRPSSRPRRAP